MLPYRDDNPTILTPYVTVALIAANLAIWVVVQGMGSDQRLAQTDPARLLAGGDLLKFPDVGASDERGPCADYDDRLDSRVMRRRLDGMENAFWNSGTERVHGRIVDGDNRDILCMR